MNTEVLRSALREAVAEAAEINKAGDVGGTCNFDAAVLCLPGKPTHLLEEMGKELGVCIRRHKSGQFIICYPAHQGLTQTRIAEAMTATLKRYGFEAFTFYMMD